MCTNSIWKRGGWTFNVLLVECSNAIGPHFRAMWCIFSHHLYFRECIGLRWVQKAKKDKTIQPGCKLWSIYCSFNLWRNSWPQTEGACTLCVSGPLTWSIDHTARLAVLSDNSEKNWCFFLPFSDQGYSYLQLYSVLYLVKPFFFHLCRVDHNATLALFPCDKSSQHKK